MDNILLQIQVASGIEIDDVVIEENKISITSTKLQMTYIGTLKNDTISGPIHKWVLTMH